MSKTTEKNTKTDRYAEAEAEVQTLLAAWKKAEQEEALAHDIPGRVKARLRSGDSSVTAADLAAAAFEVERAELLTQAAKAAHQRAERNMLVRPTLADAFLPYLSSVFGEDVRIEVVDTMPEIAAEPPAEPVLYVRQTAKTQSDPSEGTYKGELEVAYERRDLFAAADFDRLSGARAQRLGIFLEINAQGTSTHGKTHRDRARVVVHQFIPEPMVLNENVSHLHGTFWAGEVKARVMEGRGWVNAPVSRPE